MTNKNNLTIIILCCLMLFSCAWGASFTQTGKKYSPYKGMVQIYYEPPVGLSYEEIGLVSAEANEVHLKTSMINVLKEKAASKGANAIILTGFEKNDRNGDLFENKQNINQGMQSGNARANSFRPQSDYTPKVVTMKARAIRIEPVQ